MQIRFQADADFNQIIVNAAEALILIWAVTKPEEWMNRVAYLPI